MNSAYVELALGPLRQMRRSLLGWGIGLGSLVAVTVAFWPAFRGSSGISEAIDQLPSGVIEAFGLAGFGTPAGFLRGNLYEFIVPLLLAIAAVAAANGLTAAEEDAGRMETYLSQPVSRRSVFIGRTVAMTVWLAILTSSVLVVQLVSDAVVGLADRRDAGRLDRGALRVARAPVRRTGARGRRMAAAALPGPCDRGRGGRRRLPHRRAVPVERSAQALERPVALEMGSRRRPAGERSGAMAIPGSDRACVRPGGAGGGGIHPAGRPRSLNRRQGHHSRHREARDQSVIHRRAPTGRRWEDALAGRNALQPNDSHLARNRLSFRLTMTSHAVPR